MGLTRVGQATLGLVAVAASGTALAIQLGNESSPTGIDTVTLTELVEPGEYIGPCSIVTPPEPDPCQAAQLVLRYQFFGHMVNADQYKIWRKGAPGDRARLDTLLATPKCSTASNPQPQIMVTKFGAALADVVEAYACALGTEPITLPVPNPPLDPTRSDKTSPTPPSDLTIPPTGVTG
jgi:hypothetical protein